MATSRQIEKILRVWSGNTRAAISVMISPGEEIINICIINADGSMSFAQTKSFDELIEQIHASEDQESAQAKLSKNVVMN
jgi:hypothetical protein